MNNGIKTANGIGMRVSILRHLMISFLALLCFAGYATDFTLFLNHELKFEVEKIESITASKAKVEEKYLTADQFGNRYHLSVMAPLRSQAAVSVSIFLEALGIPNFPLYPGLAKRGESGILSIEQLKHRIGDNGPSQLIGSHQEHFSVILQSLTFDKQEVPKKLTPLQAAEIFNFTLTQFLTGSFSDEKDPFKKMTLYHGHFYPNDLTRSFQHFNDQSADEALLLENLRWLDQHPLVNGEADEFLYYLNSFLSHLERFSDRDFDKIFSDFFNSKEHYQHDRGHHVKDLKVELRQRVKQLRQIVLKQLEELNFSPSKTAMLKSAVKAQRPVIHLPEFRLTPGNIPPIDSHNPVEMLWALYFSETHQLHSEALTKWGAEHKANPILHLQAKASKDNTKFFHVNAYSDLDYIGNFRDKNTFETLNPKLQDTLFVLSVNDLEADHIYRLLQRAKAKVLKFETNRGTNVDGSVDRIVEAAVLADVKRIVTIELPPKDMNSEKKLREKFKFYYIDHHSMGDIDRFNKRSSLEQVAMFIGHKLTFEDFVVGVNDSSIIYGLRDLGLNKTNIKRFLDYASNGEYRVSKYIENLPFQETKFGRVYISYNDHFSLGRTSGQLAYLNYPNTVSAILIEENKIRFSGHPELTRKLMRAFENHPDYYQLMFSGGDDARSKFFGLKRIESDHMGDVLNILETELGISIDRTKLNHQLAEDLKRIYIQAKELQTLLQRLMYGKESERRRKLLHTLEPKHFSYSHFLHLSDFALLSNDPEDINAVLDLVDKFPQGPWEKMLRILRNKYAHSNVGWQRKVSLRARILENIGDKNCHATISKFLEHE